MAEPKFIKFKSSNGGDFVVNVADIESIRDPGKNELNDYTRVSLRGNGTLNYFSAESASELFEKIKNA